MTLTGLCESDVEKTALDIFRDLGYEVLYGYEVAPGERDQIRNSFEEYLLESRLEDAIFRLNKTLPRDAHEAAQKILTNPGHTTLIQNNIRSFMRCSPVESRSNTGERMAQSVEIRSG